MENNKLIAEFMGMEYDKETDRWYDKEAKLPEPYHKYIPFHYSWDWLMPVVEKIEMMLVPFPEKYRKIGRLKNVTKASVWFQIIYDDKAEFLGWSFSVALDPTGIIKEDDTRYKTKIEATYKAVVEFIKWYNTQEK